MPRNFSPLLFLLFLLPCSLAISVYVDPTKVSVSGISSGGYMAVQLHVAYSKLFMGAGIVAGGPYWCANSDVAIALTSCMVDPGFISVTELIAATDYAATLLSIDDPYLLARSKIYLYSGTLDTTVKPGVVKKLESYYRHYAPDDSHYKLVYDHKSGHTFPTLNWGIPCDITESPYIGKCGYDAAGDILNHIYGTLAPPKPQDPANLFMFRQKSYMSENISNPIEVGMDSNAFVYIPAACRRSGANCPLHVALHGCHQYIAALNDTFAVHTGYNEWAEANNIVVLYPQAHTVLLLNPKGCWDWWGYTGPEYATKLAPQMRTIHSMVESMIKSHVIG